MSPLEFYWMLIKVMLWVSVSVALVGLLVCRKMNTAYLTFWGYVALSCLLYYITFRYAAAGQTTYLLNNLTTLFDIAFGAFWFAFVIQSRRSKKYITIAGITLIVVGVAEMFHVGASISLIDFTAMLKSAFFLVLSTFAIQELMGQDHEDILWRHDLFYFFLGLCITNFVSFLFNAFRLKIMNLSPEIFAIFASVDLFVQMSSLLLYAYAFVKFTSNKMTTY